MKTLGLAALSALCCLAQQNDGSFLNRHIPLNQARRWQGLSMRPVTPVLIAGGAAQAVRTSCGHIIAFIPPSNQDPGIVAAELPKDGSVIPTVKSMAVCSSDVRPLERVSP